MEELGEPEELSSEFLSTPKAKSLKHLKNQILAIFSGKSFYEVCKRWSQAISQNNCLW